MAPQAIWKLQTPVYRGGSPYRTLFEGSISVGNSLLEMFYGEPCHDFKILSEGTSEHMALVWNMTISALKEPSLAPQPRTPGGSP